MSAQPPNNQPSFMDKFGNNSHGAALQEEYRKHIRATHMNPEWQPQSKPSVPNLTNNETYMVGILPNSGQRELNNKQHYGRVLENQAREREMQQRRKKQEELALEKKMLEDRANNDPFGKDRQNYLRAYQRSIVNARNGFVGIGNQIVNQAPSYIKPKEEVSERVSHQEPAPVVDERELNELRKQIQQDELRRSYEEQIVEREKKKAEEIRKKAREEFEEEERIKKHNAMQLAKMNEEKNKILQAQYQWMAQHQAQEFYKNYLAQMQAQAELYRPPPEPKIEEILPPPPEPIKEEVPEIDPREAEEERLREIKAGLYREMNKQVQGVVKQEMGKLKTQMNAQSHMLKDQLLTLKNQVLLVEELKADADAELQKLVKDVKGLDVYEDIRTRNLSKYLKDVSHLYRNTEPISDNDNFDFKFPTRRYRPMPKSQKDLGDQELMAEIHHLPVQEVDDVPKIYKTEKQPDILLKESGVGQYGIPTDDYTRRTKGLILPDYIDLNTSNPYYQEARTENLLRKQEFNVLDNIDDNNLYDRNEKRLDALNNLHQAHETRKLDQLLKDSLLRQNEGWSGY